MIDSEEKTSSEETFHLTELFQALQDSIWVEMNHPGPTLAINSYRRDLNYRRDLQREYLRHLIGMVVRDANAPEDVRTLSRYQLEQLQQQIRSASNGQIRMEVATRAHLMETAARIDETLKAQMQRMAY